MTGRTRSLLAVAAELGQAGVLTSHGRAQETEADLEGLRMAHAAGIDGRALADFFLELQQRQGEATPAALAWLSSHPQLDERAASIRSHWQRLGPLRAQPLALDWDEVRKHARDPVPVDSQTGQGEDAHVPPDAGPPSQGP